MTNNQSNYNTPQFIFVDIPEEIVTTVNCVTEQQDQYDKKLRAVIDLFRNRVGARYRNCERTTQSEDNAIAYMAMAIFKANQYIRNLELPIGKNTPEKAAKLKREIGNLLNLVNAEVKDTVEHTRIPSRGEMLTPSSHASFHERERRRLEKLAELTRHCVDIARDSFGEDSQEHYTQLEKCNEMVEKLRKNLGFWSVRIANKIKEIRMALQKVSS